MLSGPRKWVTSNVDGRMRSWAIVVASVNLPPSHCRACVISPSVDVRCKQGLPKGSSIITTDAVDFGSCCSRRSALRAWPPQHFGKQGIEHSAGRGIHRVACRTTQADSILRPRAASARLLARIDVCGGRLETAGIRAVGGAGSRRPGIDCCVRKEMEAAGPRCRTPPQSLRRLGLCSICPAQLGTPCPY